MNRKLIKQAFLKTLPVLAGYIVLGIGFGILLRNAGYGVLWAFAMSAFIYAGSMQYVGVSLLTGGASVITTALTTIMVNARHLFYSISMVDRYKDAGKYRPYLIFALTDETYSLLSDGHAPSEGDPSLYRFLVSLFNQSYWVTGSVLGSLLGAVLPFSTKGIEFSMTALFIASFTEQWLCTHDHVPALTGLLSTLVCLLVLGPGRFLIPAMLLITLVLTLPAAERRQLHEGNHSDRGHVCRDYSAALPSLSGHPREDASLYRLSGESTAPRYYRHACNLLSQRRELSFRSLRASRTGGVSLCGHTAGIAAELPAQHSGGNDPVYAADLKCSPAADS